MAFVTSFNPASFQAHRATSNTTHPWRRPFSTPPSYPRRAREVRSCANAAAAPQSAESSAPASSPGAPSYSTPASLAVFRNYFSAMSGAWNSDRTYHYVPERRRESSQTTFNVSRLVRPQLDAVLESNGKLSLSPEERTFGEGFRVSFLTRMESSATLVESATNLAFIPEYNNKVSNNEAIVTGNYYRDLGYEEKGPVAAKFSFDPAIMTLTMTTHYTRVVSVDEIQLINPDLRLRKIVNYKRPSRDDAPLSEVLLVGFGVEHKGEKKPLVEQYE